MEFIQFFVRDFSTFLATIGLRGLLTFECFFVFTYSIFIASKKAVPCPEITNQPPLKFHKVHGDNIRLGRNGTVAKRYESFNKGVTFSNRPVKINERVYIRLSEISNNWDGVIRIGFSNNDPTMLRDSIKKVKYACPDLTNKPGFWAKAVNERYCSRDTVIFFYVTAAGVVNYGVNGKEKGVFFVIPPPCGPLWTMIDVYGNCTTIEYLDARMFMYEQYAANHQSAKMPTSPQRHNTSGSRILPSMESLAMHDDRSSSRTHLNASVQSLLHPVAFHRTRGRNIVFSADKMIATRDETEFSQGYVFTGRPLCVGEKLIVQVLRTEPMYIGALAFGLTSCDPATLRPHELPDDSDVLLDRPEYWVVSKDIASRPVTGDELIFSITMNGEVQMRKNGGAPTTIMHVDQDLQLWAFFDVYGSTQSIRVLSQMAGSPHYRSPIAQTTSMVSLQRQTRFASTNLVAQAQMSYPNRSISVSNVTQSPNRIISGNSELIPIHSTPGSRILVVNLPPTTPSPSVSPSKITTTTTVTAASTHDLSVSIQMLNYGNL